jgi:hypothetical protein
MRLPFVAFTGFFRRIDSEPGFAFSERPDAVRAKHSSGA